jgi:DtxR family transcriptional regulator, Mn-dependent transcriptional regulator
MALTSPMSANLRRHRATSEEEHATDTERAYLEVITYLADRNEPVFAAQLARWFHVRPPTVTNMVQRLEQKGYITRDDSHHIALTATGQELANTIVRRHRQLERFLFDIMGVPWHLVHQEAGKLEPALSPLLEARILALVGNASTCPHGNPIPGSGAVLRGAMQLHLAPSGARFLITRIDEEAGEDTCTLQFLAVHGLTPDTELAVLQQSPTFGLRVRHGKHQVSITPHVAMLIWGEVVA